MARIALENMRFFAYHGVYPWEAEAGHEFSVDLIMETDISAAGRSDQIEDTVDYGKAYENVKAVMSERVNLLETLVSRIGKLTLHSLPQVKAVTVRVSKYMPKAGGPLDRTWVEETFTRPA